MSPGSALGSSKMLRPLQRVREEGFEIEREERFKLGMVERLVARKPP